jgi:hypothetical protein
LDAANCGWGSTTPLLGLWFLPDQECGLGKRNVNSRKKEKMKLIGFLMAVVGWLVPVVTLVVTQSLAARLMVCLLGLAISLVGILVVMNKAHLKEAIWKS